MKGVYCLTRVLLVSLFFVPAACFGGGTPVIEPGDVLSISVWNHEDLSMTVTVSPDGWISYPLTGRLSVAGRTADSIQKDIEAAVARQIREPRVAVNVAEAASHITVLGEVRSPGQFPLRRASTLLEAIASAGGTNDAAWLERVTVIRAGGEIEAVNLAPVRAGSGLAANVELRSGDLVLVPKLELRVVVLGQVSKPGSYQMTRPQTTAIDAVSAAGGPLKDAKLQNAVIVRRENGAQAVIRVDLKRVAVGESDSRDTLLRDGDIVYVPESHRLDWDRGFQAIIGLASLSNLILR